MTLLSDQDRQLLHTILRNVDEAQLAAHNSARSFRNLLLVATLGLALGAVLFPLIASRTDPNVLALTSSMSSAAGLKLLATIELWGMVGGLIGALAAVWGVRGSATPIGLQLAQMVLKLPAGAWTGLVGVIFLQSSLIPSVEPAQMNTLATYAIIFGAGQQAFTRFVDQRASALLDKTKTQSETAVLPS